MTDDEFYCLPTLKFVKCLCSGPECCVVCCVGGRRVADVFICVLTITNKINQGPDVISPEIRAGAVFCFVTFWHALSYLSVVSSYLLLHVICYLPTLLERKHHCCRMFNPIVKAAASIFIWQNLENPLKIGKNETLGIGKGQKMRKKEHLVAVMC